MTTEPTDYTDCYVCWVEMTTGAERWARMTFVEGREEAAQRVAEMFKRETIREIVTYPNGEARRWRVGDPTVTEVT